MAVHVDAQTDMLVLASGAPDYNAAYSIGGWFNLQADRDTFAFFLTVGFDASNTDSVGTTISGTTLRTDVRVAATSHVINSTTDLVVGDWYFVVMERISSTSFKAYLFDADGTLLENLDPAADPDVSARTAADRVTVGGNIDNPTFWANTLVAGVKVFESALGVDGWRREMWQYAPHQSPYAVWPMFAQTDYNDYGPGGRTLSTNGLVAATAVGPPIAWRRGRSRVVSSAPAEVVHTATAALTAGAATLSASATFTEKTYTATSALTVGAATLSASGTFTEKTYTATAALTSGAATLAASATHTDPEYTATSALTAGAATLSASATHLAKTYTGTSVLTVGAATLSASAAHDHPVYTAVASLVTAAVTLSASGTHAAPVYTASAALTVGAATLAGVATHEDDRHIPLVYGWGAIGGPSLVMGV